MKVAVIGAGIAGLACAHRLQGFADVTLFEAEDRLGGHTDTHPIEVDGRAFAVDSGFIVFNQENYPLFSAWLDELRVDSHPSNMSFSVSDAGAGIEYGTDTPGALFSQPGNVVSPDHWRMLLDLRRFYAEAASDLAGGLSGTLGAYLAGRGYSERFIHHHIAPMCGALWSQGSAPALDIPAEHVLAFMNHHRMLQVNGRPDWRVVTGGSSTYVRAFENSFNGEVVTGRPVRVIERLPTHVDVFVEDGSRSFDAVFVCVHSDQALAMLADASPAENQILGAIRYHANTTVLHGDRRFMPRRRRAWASWNARVEDSDVCSVTYWMNRLQRIEGPEFFVTLNPRSEPADVWVRRRYSHPVFDEPARLAQQRRAEIDGVNRTFFCGAYWGWGFHEDGFASARASVDSFLEVRYDAA